MSERILVLDPGERVGWCHAEVIEGDEWLGREGMSTYTKQVLELNVTGHGITPLRDMALALEKNIHKYDTVIYETWRLYKKNALSLSGSDMQSSQFIGMVRLLCWLHPSIKLVSQGASCMTTGEKTAPPAIREILDRLPQSHDEAHDGSALRHLSYYYFQKYVGLTQERA